MNPTGLVPNLSGVPETMLWTLHNRASEARRPDGVLRDEACLRIYDTLDYDFEASFGRANPSHGVRSALFDRYIRDFVAESGAKTVINLGEGLETQRFRLDDLDLRWWSVDVPEAIAIREQFIEPDTNHLHLPGSVLDPGWMKEAADGPACITAQGLLMYLPDEAIEPLLSSMAERFPGSSFAFDTIPPWFSRRTMAGKMKITPTYAAPPMPFGATLPELRRRIRRAVPGARVEQLPWRMPRGASRVLTAVAQAMPVLRNHTPAVWAVRFPR